MPQTVQHLPALITSQRSGSVTARPAGAPQVEAALRRARCLSEAERARAKLIVRHTARPQPTPPRYRVNCHYGSARRKHNGRLARG